MAQLIPADRFGNAPEWVPAFPDEEETSVPFVATSNGAPEWITADTEEF